MPIGNFSIIYIIKLGLSTSPKFFSCLQILSIDTKVDLKSAILGLEGVILRNSVCKDRLITLDSPNRLTNISIAVL